MSYQTLDVSFRDGICTARIDRGDPSNTLSAQLIAELGEVVAICEAADRAPPITVLILEGRPESFCTGADFDAMVADGQAPWDPALLYDLWIRLATGPFVSISVVRGRVNAGGMGFIAASDLVLADSTARFSLSELLFGLFPACVLPFLVRKIGFQKAHYLTLTTRPIEPAEARAWGLVDAVEDRMEPLLRKHLVRLQRLSKPALARYKSYMAELSGLLEAGKPRALAANAEMFSDPENQRNIRRYVEEAKFPWEP